jgi:hypothetical protein
MNLPEGDVLDKIIRSLPNGTHYYIVTPDDKAIDGPWGKEEIGKRFAACTVEGAEIAYWCDQTWVRRLHYYRLVDRAQPFRGVGDFTGVKDD